MLLCNIKNKKIRIIRAQNAQNVSFKKMILIKIF